jgi:hypothetical protein
MCQQAAAHTRPAQCNNMLSSSLLMVTAYTLVSIPTTAPSVPYSLAASPQPVWSSLDVHAPGS